LLQIAQAVEQGNVYFSVYSEQNTWLISLHKLSTIVFTI